MHVRTDTEDWGWGSLVATRKLGLTPSKAEAPLIGRNEPSPLIAVNQNYVLDVLLNIGVTENGICPFPYNGETTSGEKFSVFVFVFLLFTFRPFLPHRKLN